MESTKTSNLGTAGVRLALNDAGGNEANKSGVSWPAVWAGGFVTAALSLILLALGTGLGFASVSVWSGSGVSASKVGAAAILWFIIIQFISASMGGYLAGRLRTKWTGIHSDEVYFRDTAHGFLAWSVALVVTAAFLTSAATALIGSSVDPTRSGASASHSDLTPNAYYIDSSSVRMARSRRLRLDRPAVKRQPSSRLPFNAANFTPAIRVTSIKW